MDIDTIAARINNRMDIGMSMRQACFAEGLSFNSIYSHLRRNGWTYTGRLVKTAPPPRETGTTAPLARHT